MHLETGLIILNDMFTYGSYYTELGVRERQSFLKRSNKSMIEEKLSKTQIRSTNQI